MRMTAGGVLDLASRANMTSSGRCGARRASSRNAALATLEAALGEDEARRVRDCLRDHAAHLLRVEAIRTGECPTCSGFDDVQDEDDPAWP